MPGGDAQGQLPSTPQILPTGSIPACAPRSPVGPTHPAPVPGIGVSLCLPRHSLLVGEGKLVSLDPLWWGHRPPAVPTQAPSCPERGGAPSALRQPLDRAVQRGASPPIPIIYFSRVLMKPSLQMNLLRSVYLSVHPRSASRSTPRLGASVSQGLVRMGPSWEQAWGYS